MIKLNVHWRAYKLILPDTVHDIIVLLYWNNLYTSIIKLKQLLPSSEIEITYKLSVAGGGPHVIKSDCASRRTSYPVIQINLKTQ